jgi:CHAD domain-containing protein
MEPDFVKLKQIKPALAGYLRRSEGLLKAGAFPDEDTVHDVRVLMKKARAVLKLMAPQLDSVFYERENMSLREAGRRMKMLRESFVLRKTLKELKKKYPEIFSKLEDNETINLILKKPGLIEHTTYPVKENLDNPVDILNKTGFRIRFEPMTNLDPQLLLKELEMTYNRVVNNYILCRNKPKQSTLHDLRKSAKDFSYQLWFFRPLNPVSVKSLEKKLTLITQNLGKFNDLEQLIIRIGYRYEYAANNPALDTLVLIIRKEQDKYLSRVWPAAYKIFCPGINLLNLLGFKLLML